MGICGSYILGLSLQKRRFVLKVYKIVYYYTTKEFVEFVIILTITFVIL